MIFSETLNECAKKYIAFRNCNTNNYKLEIKANMRLGSILSRDTIYTIM